MLSISKLTVVFITPGYNVLRESGNSGLYPPGIQCFQVRIVTKVLILRVYDVLRSPRSTTFSSQITKFSDQ